MPEVKREQTRFELLELRRAAEGTMRLRELILELQELYREEGDIEMFVETYAGAHLNVLQVNSGYWVNQGERSATIGIVEVSNED